MNKKNPAVADNTQKFRWTVDVEDDACDAIEGVLHWIARFGVHSVKYNHNRRDIQRMLSRVQSLSEHEDGECGEPQSLDADCFLQSCEKSSWEPAI